MKKNTVIFDLDGTLLDTLTDLKNSTNYAMEKLGFPARSQEEVRSFVGNGIGVLVKKAVPEGTSQEDIREAFQLLKSHYAEHCNDFTKPYDGIPELISCLQEKGIKMAIVSNKPDPAVKNLSRIFFAGRIPVAIGEMEAEGVRRKPAPDTVYRALDLLGSSNEESVYVGDSEVDIETSRNAGLDVILCSWGFRDEAFLKSIGAQTIIHHPMELPDLL